MAPDTHPPAAAPKVTDVEVHDVGITTTPEEAIA